MTDERSDGLFFPSHPSPRRNVFWIASIACVYFAAARVGLSLEVEPEGIAPVWLPAGIFLSAILLSRRNLRPRLVVVLGLTDFIAELLAGTPWQVSALYSGALAGDAVLSAWLLIRFVGEPVSFSRTREVIGFLVLAVVLSNSVMSLAAAAAATLIPGTSFWISWRWWAASDGIGNLLVTPFVMSWAIPAKAGAGHWNRERVLEGAALVTLLICLNVFGFGHLSDSGLLSLLLPFCTFPFLLWGALRFGTRGVSSTLLLLAAIVIPFAVAHRFPDFSFFGSPLDDTIVIQLYLAMMAVPSLLLGAVVTERQLAVEQLRAKDALLSKAEEIARVGSWELDHATSSLIRSDEVYRIFGMTPEAFGASYRDFLDAVHPEDRAAVDEAYSKSLRESTDACDIEHRVVAKATGEIRYVREKCEHFRDASGRIVRSIGMVHDITEHKRAEKALRASEERFRALIEQAGDGFELLDADGRLLDVNSAACRQLGYSREELLRMSFADIDPVISPEAFAARFRLLEGQDSMTFESVHRRKDGTTFPIEICTSVIHLGDDPKALTIVRDITGRKRAEQEREKLQAQLMQAQKMESVGRLAGGVAHDFNNMLGVILGHAELALSDVPADGPLRASLQEIQAAALRSAELTRQLLAYARKQTIAPRALDLNAAVAGMLKMLHRLIGEDIELAWLPAADLWPVKMDPAQIDQILANLCVNARDAIAEVGKVTIETEKAVFDEMYCARHPEFIVGDYVLLAVSDNGTGMSQDVLEHLFEPFFTTKDMYRGTGLGLATVYGIVKQNEGFINVYSEPGKGTIFKIYLPRHMVEVTAESVEREEESPKGGTETVLLVEDEKMILKLGTSLLGLLGYTVLAAQTPNEALDCAARHQGPIHLLITDVVMPQMNGKELRQRLAALRPEMKALFMSGYTANTIAHHGVLEQGVQFLQKPFSIKGLSAKVRETLDQK